MRIHPVVYLVEKNIKSLWVNEDQSSLFFELSHWPKSVYFELGTEADCCSETWFADIIGVHNLLEENVVGFRELVYKEAPEDDKRTRQEVDLIYGVEIYTPKGTCQIIFRNSSNGYYGGALFVDEKTCFQDKLPPNVTQITENDWRA